MQSWIFVEGEKTKNPGPAIQTKPVEKKPIPDIQPSKTHKPNNQGETKKQAQKSSKVVVNSVVQQNIINSSDDKQKQVIKSEVVRESILMKLTTCEI